MASRSSIEERLERLSGICLALPEASREDKNQHAAFLVRKKVFAYSLNDHHGDGIVSVCCKALGSENRFLAAAQPEKFYLPAYIASRGWVGLRLDRASVDWAEVEELVRGSYLQAAPKRLAALVSS